MAKAKKSIATDIDGIFAKAKVTVKNCTGEDREFLESVIEELKKRSREELSRPGTLPGIAEYIMQNTSIKQDTETICKHLRESV